MNRRHFLTGLAACPACAAIGLAAEGAQGQSRSSELDADSNVCSIGSQQSPIDIGDTIRAQLPPLRIAWSRKADTIVNNGHTIQVNFGEGSSLRVGNEPFALVQFHFHRPSEHRLGGKSYPMEVHFVHRHASGKLAVVGVLMTAGRANLSFNKVVTTMPPKEGPAVPADAGIDPNRFLPARRSYFRYEGSLTTPPCSETVAWLLLTQPMQVAEADIDAFARLYANNSRPTQKLDRRFVLRSG